MADVVTVDGVGYKRRNPWGVVGLALITLGIYYFVWWYKINNEMRNYGVQNSPAKATLAVSLGALIIVPLFVSYYNTAERIRKTQEKSGASERIIPVLGALAVSRREPVRPSLLPVPVEQGMGRGVREAEGARRRVILRGRSA